MRFPDPLIAGTLIRRYKRFLTDVELAGGETVIAHCANSGSMLSVNETGAEVWLSPARNPERKLRYTWEMIRIGGALVGINTSLPNGLVADAIGNGSIPELGGYGSLRREVKYGQNSRIDMLLEEEGRRSCYVEVKSVTMRRDLSPGAPVEFPDAVTIRGTKHLAELSREASGGARAVMVYLVQRDDAERCTIARDIDPAYGDALDAALDAGVETLCYGCRLSVDGIDVTGPVAFDG